MSVKEADVLIVGGGPVGLTLAAEISYRGMSAILIERRRTTSNSPRALAVNSRSMEHFRRLGLQEKFQAAAYPRNLRPTTFFSTGLCTGNCIARKEFSSWGEIDDCVKGTESLYFKEGCSAVSPLFCPQFTNEAVIYKHIQDTATNISLCFGWQVKSFSQDDSGVEVNAVSDDGEEEVFRGRYLVGCDGGASFVRKELGLHMYGKFVLARACTIFLNSPQLVDVMKDKGYMGLGMVINPNIMSFVALLNMKGDFAVHIIKTPFTSDEELDDMVKNPSRSIDAILGCSGFPYDVIEASGYNMHGLVTTRFSVGRCFLAGDSAHQWLPAGGLGLNSGISDVADLAWKLEALVKGYGGKFLADSYEVERRPLDDSTRHFAMMAGGFMRLVDTPPFVVFTTLLKKSSLLRRLAQPSVLGVVNGTSTTGLDLVLGFQYSNSSIVMHQYNEDGSITLKSHGAKSSLPGCRAPHVVLPDGSSIVDLFGKTFLLLIIGGQIENDLVDLKEVFKQRSVPFEVHAYPLLPELIEMYDRKFFLVRPDGVIAWRSDYQPSVAESNKIVSTILGHSVPVRLPPLITKFDSVQETHLAKFGGQLLARYGFMYFLSTYFNVPLINCLTFTALGLVIVRAATVKLPAEYRQKTSRHRAVVIDKYGNAENVLRVEPKYMRSFGPDDVLIQVYSSSVNELDIQMRRGRGSSHYQKAFKVVATGSTYFPLVLGRDCSGRVVAVGDNVSKFLPGDLVYAVVPPHQPGTYAQLVAVNEKCVAFKPTNVDHKEAASVPWVATTAWTAVVKHAGLNPHNARGKKILVHDGTCGVSSFAVQLLKAWGAHVTVTCSAEDVNLAHRLGVDKAVDIHTGDFSAVLRGFDFVLDPIGGTTEGPSLSVLKWYQQAVYVTTNSPQQYLVDRLGGFIGNFTFAWLYRFKVIFNCLFKGKRFYYVDAVVNGEYLDDVRNLIEQGAVRPVVDAVYSLDEVVAAHKHVETGQTRGKVVIAMP